MKHLILTCLACLFTTALAFGQAVHCPDEWFKYPEWRDTISNSSNIWQYSIQNKNIPNLPIFLDSFLVTDSSAYYPTNDTSIYYISDVDFGGYSYPQTAVFSCVYYCQTDSMRDYATIYISPDNGQTWFDMLDTQYFHIRDLIGTVPDRFITGNSNGWRYFSIDLRGFSNLAPQPIQQGDSILLKITFISDSIPDSLPGIIFGNICFYNDLESVNKTQDNSLISIYPNPTQSTIYINRQETASDESIEIFNTLGIKVWEQNAFVGNEINLRALGLPAGIYTLRYSNSRRFAVQRFVYLN